MSSKSKELPYIATLKRGRYYDLGGKVFENGASVQVTEAEKSHLENFAFEVRLSWTDETTGEQHFDEIEMFTFIPNHKAKGDSSA